VKKSISEKAAAEMVVRGGLFRISTAPFFFLEITDFEEYNRGGSSRVFPKERPGK
jgi:hypothetical protein